MRRPCSRTWHIGGSVLFLCCAPLVVAAFAADTGSNAHGGRTGVVDQLMDSIDRSLVPRCLTPEVERAMSEVVGKGALQPILGDDLVLVKGDIGAGIIAVAIRDNTQTYSVTLALPGARHGPPAAMGKRFAFYVDQSPSPPPRAAAALLAIGRLFDDAIPDSAIVRCAGANAPQTDRRYPRALALGSALAEVLAVAAAIAYGLRALRAVT